MTDRLLTSKERNLLTEARDLLRQMRSDIYEHGTLYGRTQHAGEDLLHRLDAHLTPPVETSIDWKARAERAEEVLGHNMALANATTRRTMDERNAIIRKLREKYSAIEIADMVGLTRQRVHQILNEAPLTEETSPPHPGPSIEKAFARSPRRVVNCGNPVMVNSEWYGPCTLPSGHEGDCKRTQKASTEGRPLTAAEAKVIEEFGDELVTIYPCKCGATPGTTIRGQMFCTNCGEYRADKSQVNGKGDV